MKKNNIFKSVMIIMVILVLFVSTQTFAFSFKDIFFHNNVKDLSMKNATENKTQENLKDKNEDREEVEKVKIDVEKNKNSLDLNVNTKTFDREMKNFKVKDLVKFNRFLSKIDLVSLSKYGGLAIFNYNSDNALTFYKYGKDHFVIIAFADYSSENKSVAFVSENWKNWKPGDEILYVSKIRLKVKTSIEALEWYKLMRDLEEKKKMMYFFFSTSDCEKDEYGFYVCTVDLDSSTDMFVIENYF